MSYKVLLVRGMTSLLMAVFVFYSIGSVSAQDAQESDIVISSIVQNAKVQKTKVEVVLNKDNYEVGDEIVAYIILTDLIEIDTNGEPQLRKVDPEQLEGLFILKNKKSAMVALELEDADTKKPCIEKQKKEISIDAPVAIISTIALIDCKKPLTSVLISKDGELPVTNSVKVSNDNNGLSGEQKVDEIIESNDNMIQPMDQSDNNFSIKSLVVIFGGIFLFGLIAFLVIQRIYRD